jgi:predicted glycoside hydrolase/deacetylase ChbG (UPF0249 family)
MMIINADDWGRSVEETDAALACYAQRRITSVSAMVFMVDSERAAKIAQERGIPTGLHINFNEPFSATVRDDRLRQDHFRIMRFLNRHRFALLLYNPFLRESFRYVFQAQVGEFLRLYGKRPTHFDGHQHMHLCLNMLGAAIIPRGEKVRRSFSFQPGEKGLVNRCYRASVDRWLGARHRLTDYFFALSQQLAEERFARVCRLALEADVELMTHPAIPREQVFLNSDQCFEALRTTPTGSYREL